MRLPQDKKWGSLFCIKGDKSFYEFVCAVLEGTIFFLFWKRLFLKFKSCTSLRFRVPL